MSLKLGLFFIFFAAALGAMVARSRLTNHVLLGIAGAAGLLYGLSEHGLLGALLPFLMLIVAGVQAATGLVAGRSAKFTDEEKQMLAGPLAELGRAEARR